MEPVANTASAAAGGGLYQYRIADFCGNPLGLFHGFYSAVRAGHYRNAGSLHGFLGACLISQHGNGFRRRANKGDAVIDAQLCKFRTLGQKAKAGMERRCSGVLAGSNQRVLVQIAVLDRSRADADRLICYFRMERRAVCRGIHGNALQAGFPAGADNPYRNLAAVCN